MTGGIYRATQIVTNQILVVILALGELQVCRPASDTRDSIVVPDHILSCRDTDVTGIDRHFAAPRRVDDDCGIRRGRVRATLDNIDSSATEERSETSRIRSIGI